MSTLSQFNLLNPPTLGKAGDIQLWGEALSTAESLALAEAVSRHPGISVIITADTPTALRLESELAHLLLAQEVEVLLFPDWETLPYDNFSPHQDIISQRLSTLYKLQQAKQIDAQMALIVPVATLSLVTAPPSYLSGHTLFVNKGQSLPLDKLKEQLAYSGYHHVQQVLEHGEFSVRGSILDLYPMGSTVPYRIDFFDDEVDSIRPFDPESQRSEAPIDAINLLPGHEFPTDEFAIERFRTQFREQFAVSNAKESLYQQVSKKLMPAGIEYYLPLFFEQTGNLFDYLPESAQLLQVGDLVAAAEHFARDVQLRYDDRSIDPLRPLLKPDQLFLPVEKLFAECKRWPRAQLTTASQPSKVGRFNLAANAVTDIAVNHKYAEPLTHLKHYLKEHSAQVLFVVESEGRQEALLDLLHKAGIRPNKIQSIMAFVASKDAYGILVAPFEHSVTLASVPLTIITETELFGNRVRQRRRQKSSRALSPDQLIRNLAELQIGQPVVHMDHGVGRYAGLQTLEAGGMTSEFVTLEYAGNAKLYVPVTSLNMIGRYSGAEPENAPLHKLGNESWGRIKRKAAEKIRDVAAELLQIYANRAARSGVAFNLDNDYKAFSESFPFEETVDQKSAIAAVINDMSAAKSMDRLVCGDVGFGKTEVAMRAAYVAVSNGKQVAVLVPTTLLAQQHYDNFRDRFAGHAVSIEVLSRFRTAKQTQQVLDQLGEGKVDIVIGTHKLLQQQIPFNDLGLLIVDEEHRFGVRQKEKIKALRADVDILTLTATPIPRTLNMALGGMRDLSIIATPPARRLAVKTFVRQRDNHLIREAVMRELLRGGQVYFLHNSVDTIERTMEELTELLPEARIAVAHGQMRERELEQVMTDFYHQRYNILLCTTIIETGIDVASANTIIMDRADKLGLAQLHQLRGRVGRSHHQAYAYLLTPPPKRLTKDAQKRLEAIAELEDLGAGFALATHDLEIRGAGELLGEDQSGQITAIGFSLYMEMLEHAVDALQNGEPINLEDDLGKQTEIELKIPALLPDDYIFEVNLRLSFYKRIAGCRDQQSLDELQVELIDRFGLLPTPAKNLFKISELRLLAEKLGIKRIDAHGKGGVVEFASKTCVDPTFIIRLIQTQPAQYRLEGADKFRFIIPSQTSEQRLVLVEQMLAEFSNHSDLKHKKDRAR
ncbi:transcription-repair coupling factor [Corallincola luteus]|uniref:Transcription-repair-coupling factor n=1 Tax=Corallincola luteus TaxID=1775177 RepID=A0ABY2AIG7_9GAMM|nr:transcription-repair coupling factor [Corallincola luteus]TCI02475.1 transcription-repair coupling factor [Corallincola luteus]